MKLKSGIPFLLALLLCAACENDYEPDLLPDEGGNSEGAAMVTDESGTVLINEGTIEVGNGTGDDVVFEMSSTVMTAEGRVEEKTLNCCAMAALPLADGKTDSTRTVENVTLINRGTINVHTRDLVERYVDQIQNPDHPDRAYLYLRVLVMYAGQNSMVINDGVINIWFDHDPSITTTVYVMGLVGGEGSSLVNNGEMHFYGNGSVATRLRGMATFGSNISAMNTGLMTADVEMSEDARMITTGGDMSNVINDGIMQMRLPGKVLCLTRYGNSNIINNNTIEITSVDMPEGYESIVGEEDHIACALYDPLQMSRKDMPAMVNRGTISITLEGSERSNPLRQGYGMFGDLMGAGAEGLEMNIVNDGTISVRQTGPVPFDKAEAGFVARRAAIAGACNIHLGRWRTTLRNFAETRDLFLAKGAKINFSGALLQLAPGDGYVDGTAYSVAPEALVYNAGAEEGYRYEYSGYEDLSISAWNSSSAVLNWDKENQWVSLSSIDITGSDL